MRLTVDEPKSYGPDPILVAVWLVIASTPLLSSLWLCSVRGPESSDLWPLLISLAMPAGLLAFVCRFRVTFLGDSFVYRRWGPTIRVRYRDIAHLEVTNSTPYSNSPIGAFIVTRGGERLPFWPKLFPTPAITRFFKLAPRNK